MKFNKKSKIIISLALGTVMFTTTAIAQVMNKSGYDQLKDSVKYTAESCTTQLKSYTLDTSLIVKNNGKVVLSQNELSKFDVSKQVKESTSTTLENSTKRESYSYSDANGYINKNSDQDVYYVSEFTTPREMVVPSNPFKEKGASDVEKIADALVGNLKDAVVVAENADGTKTLSGSLSESQIPALINAVVSLQSKREFSNPHNNPSGMPIMTKDIFVKEIKGNMVTTKEGLIQSVLGSGAISGKDESGKEYNLTVEILAKITNIDSTKITKPDLTGKKVEKNVEIDYNKLSNPEKYIGKFKTDIIVEKNGKFEKIGEKFVDITAVDDKNISGRYYEEYSKGNEQYSTNKKDFNFEAKFESEKGFYSPFTAMDASKNPIKGSISINPGSAKVYFNLEESRSSNMLYDDQFSKVFN